MLARIIAGIVASILALVAPTVAGEGGDKQHMPATTTTTVTSPPPAPSTTTSSPPPVLADHPHAENCGGWFGLVANVFPSAHHATACRVLLCESEGNPHAVNRSSGASGLFQVMPEWASRYEQVTGLPYYDGRFDPHANATFAWYLVQDSGWSSQFACY